MARIFNGTTQYLRRAVANFAAPPCTMVAWVKPSANDGTHAAVSISDEGGTSHFHNLGISSGGYCRVSGRMGSGTVGSLGTVIVPNGSWTHLAGIHLSDTSRTSYTNGGDKVVETTDMGTYSANKDNICIAALRRSSGQADFFAGKIHSVAVWDKALTDAQIAALAAGVDPSAIENANLVGNWQDLGRTLVGAVGGTLVDMTDDTTTDSDTPFSGTSRLPIYALSSVSGLQKWVDYIPVAVPTAYDALDIDTYNTDGVRRTIALRSVTGLRAWVDYTPVYVVTATAGKQWRTDGDGWIPVTHV